MREYHDQLFIKPIPIGSLIEEYEILHCIGQGGFGTTYLCFDKNLGRKCIIKEYTPQGNAFRKVNANLFPLLNFEFESGLNDFLQEAKNLALFNHPNIVKINRFFKANSTGYIVMDFEQGISLREIINSKKIFEEKEIESIIIPLCSGIQELHNKSLIHRDIKPDNIIIRPNGSPILIDFGSIGNLNDINEIDYKIYITPHYAPIEQFNLKFPQGNWIDIYALGATIYELIAGFPPPTSLERIRDDKLKPIYEIGNGVYGGKLLRLVDKSLSLNYKERPISIGHFVDFFKFDKYSILKEVVQSITDKSITHFLNFANPNEGLLVSEFVSFIVGFSIIDLTWRLGRGRLMDDELFDKLIDNNLIESCISTMVDAGFNKPHLPLNQIAIKSRLEEYAASYLLDRQEENWTYTLTRKQCTRNCIKDTFENDKNGFFELLEDVIDRYRGRIKKELNKFYID